jgi:hypothetical protein
MLPEGGFFEFISPISKGSVFYIYPLAVKL